MNQSMHEFLCVHHLSNPELREEKTGWASNGQNALKQKMIIPETVTFDCLQ